MQVDRFIVAKMELADHLIFQIRYWHKPIPIHSVHTKNFR